jgi:hypothetical protein
MNQEIMTSQGGSLKALDSGPADTERDKKYFYLSLQTFFSIPDFHFSVICWRLTFIHIWTIYLDH